MNLWLRDFASHIDFLQISGVFLFAAGMSLIIAMATVSFHAIRAAVANPIESLRYE